MTDQPSKTTQRQVPHPTDSLSDSDRRVRARYGAWGLEEGVPTSPSSSSPDGDSEENQDLEHIGLFFYLIPVVGFFPSLWTLYRRTGSREQRVASRLSVTLALGWLVGYVLLETGARSSELFTVPLLLLSSLLTSSYFVVNMWLMIQLWQRRPLRLPGVTRVAEKVVGRHLP